ncbi:hypothetical protein LT330_001519 [Penicillium expansum]|nr:hypothetical protein LT330_001519 [Penicillium expansum]
MWCVQRWLGMALDLFVAGIAIILVAFATSIRGSGSTGYLGVALYQIVTLSTTLQTLVTEWTQIEMALGAISHPSVVAQVAASIPRYQLSSACWSFNQYRFASTTSTSAPSLARPHARFNSLPQDPFFLQGTVRENLDLLGVTTNEHLVQALQSVRLWDFCESCGGLDEDMNEGTFVLVMEEVGGSVDADTDALIHEILQKEFESCTVIAIVYKIHT